MGWVEQNRTEYNAIEYKRVKQTKTERHNRKEQQHRTANGGMEQNKVEQFRMAIGTAGLQNKQCSPQVIECPQDYLVARLNIRPSVQQYLDDSIVSFGGSHYQCCRSLLRTRREVIRLDKITYVYVDTHVGRKAGKWRGIDQNRIKCNYLVCQLHYNATGQDVEEGEWDVSNTYAIRSELQRNSAHDKHDKTTESEGGKVGRREGGRK